MPNLMITLTEIAGAWAMAVVIGICLGYAIGMNNTIADIYEPFFYVIFSIPLIIVYPVIYLWVGVGETSKMIFGALLGLFPLTINTISGFRQINPLFFRLSKSLRLGSGRTLLRIVLPAAAPSLMAGLRQSLASATIGVVTGEILASSQGLGFIIVYADSTLNVGLLFAMIVLVLVIAFAFTEVLRVIEKRMYAHAT